MNPVDSVDSVHSVEERIRAATLAAGEAVREVRRPLRLDPVPPPGHGALARRPRRLKAWMAPATAAAAVVLLAVSLVIVRGIPNGRVVPPAGHGSTAGAVPPYYVALSYPLHPGDPEARAPFSGATYLVVGETFTGARLATVAPPDGATFTGVTGAADDRTFVVDTAPLTTRNTEPGQSAATGPRTWYLLRLHPGASAASAASAARLTRLPIPVTPDGTLIYGIAVSPDGTELAVASGRSAQSSAEILRIYSIRTGALLFAWSPSIVGYPPQSPDQGPDSNATLFWASNGRGLTWDWRASASASAAGGIDVRLEEVPIPRHDPLSYVDDSAYIPGCSPSGGLLVVADGNSVVCAQTGVLADMGPAPETGTVVGCVSFPVWNDLGFLEYQATTARLTRTPRTIRTSCEAGIGLAGALWASATGDQVIGWVDAPPNGAGRPYVFTADGYRPLAFFPSGAVFGGVAW